MQDVLQGSKVLVNKLANATLRSSSSAASLSSRPGRHWKRRSSAESSELSATTTPGTFSARGDTISESNADLVVPRVTLQEQQSEIPESGGETGHLRVIVCGDSGIDRIMQPVLSAYTLLDKNHLCVRMYARTNRYRQNCSDPILDKHARGYILRNCHPQCRNVIYQSLRRRK